MLHSKNDGKYTIRKKENLRQSERFSNQIEGEIVIMQLPNYQVLNPISYLLPLLSRNKK
jgi:hypothetical protein